jgi:hypothetical protein
MPSIERLTEIAEAANVVRKEDDIDSALITRISNFRATFNPATILLLLAVVKASKEPGNTIATAEAIAALEAAP